MVEAIGGKLYIHDSAYTLQAIHRCTLNYRPKLVIVDYLGEIARNGKSEPQDLVEWLGYATQYLRNNLARKLHCHVALIHQMSRAVEQRTDKRPVLSDLRDSGRVAARGGYGRILIP